MIGRRDVDEKEKKFGFVFEAFAVAEHGGLELKFLAQRPDRLGHVRGLARAAALGTALPADDDGGVGEGGRQELGIRSEFR